MRIISLLAAVLFAGCLASARPPLPRAVIVARSAFEGQGIEPGEVVVAVTGCKGFKDECPGLSPEAARYLASIPILAFATDNWTISDQTPPSRARFAELIKAGREAKARGEALPLKKGEDVYPEHFALLSQGVMNIEGLTNLATLIGERRVVFVGLPLKIEKGNGGPMRAAAFVY
jgi:kynurenine formamidase